MDGRVVTRTLLGLAAILSVAGFSCAVGSSSDLAATEDNLEPCQGGAPGCADDKPPSATLLEADAGAETDAGSDVVSSDASVSAPSDAAAGGAAKIADAADNCFASSLAAAGVMQAGLGAPALFTVSLDGATDTFKSGCLTATGPDRIQPIVATSGTKLRITVTKTTSISGTVVIYAKSTCGESVDLACSSTAPIEFSAQPGVTYFLHLDTTAAQTSGASITVLAEAI